MASLDLAPGLPVPAHPEPTRAPGHDRSALRRGLRWGAASLALVALATGTLLWTRAPAPPNVSYQTVALDRGPLVARVTASGTLSALVTVNVGSQISGRIDYACQQRVDRKIHASVTARIVSGAFPSRRLFTKM